MFERSLSRRQFLVGGGAVLAAVATPAVLRASTASADPTATPLPWSYDSTLDPEAVAKAAFETYYASGCAEATWWAIVQALAASTNIANAATTWGTIPKNMFRFGAAGVDGWGTICGTLNGCCAAIGMVGGDSSIADAVMQYYANTPLPTNAAYVAYKAGWTPASPAVAPRDNVVTSTAHSQLCHVSLSQWAMAAGGEGADTTDNAIGKPGQKDRCAKLSYDMAFKTITLLNAFFKSGAKPTVALDPTVAACKTCHTPNAMGKMACESCHSVSATHSSGN